MRGDVPGIVAPTRQSGARDRQDTAAGASEPSTDDVGTGGEAWRTTLLAVLREMTPAAFERLAQRALRKAGFIKVEVTGRSGDGGIDGVGVLRVNLLSS